ETWLPDRCYPLRAPRAAVSDEPVDSWHASGDSKLSSAATRNRKNTLFCQCPVQKVEPILAPEQFVAVDVGRRPEDLAINGLLRQRLVACDDLRAPGATSQRDGIQSKLAGDFHQRGFGGDVAFLFPDRTADRSGQRQCLHDALLLCGENPRGSEISVHGEEPRLHV